MHPYHIDEKLRTRVFLITGVLSIVAARGLDILVGYLPFQIPWWIEIPSVLGFFGFFVWLYDNYFWQRWPFRKLRWFYIPNLNGTWEVELASSYADFREPVQAFALIRQTGSKMCISLRTEESSSYSTFAALMRTERLNAFELKYHYINQPRPASTETMNIHYGTAWVQLSEDLNRLEGEYYSGRGRQHFGRIVFRRREV